MSDNQSPNKLRLGAKFFEVKTYLSCLHDPTDMEKGLLKKETTLETPLEEILADSLNSCELILIFEQVFKVNNNLYDFGESKTLGEAIAYFFDPPPVLA